MSYRIIDYPHFVPETEYQKVLDAMVKRLAQFPQTLSVYQIGSIGTPGISDLDMVVVFKDGQKVGKNFLNNLSANEKYLFIHNLYGISENDFREAERFTFFNNFTLLFGTKAQANLTLLNKETEILKKQLAIEYLFKMCINIYLQHKYRVLRMRDLLLHVKALRYDLDFLGIRTGKLTDKIMQIIDWRKNWFKHTPSREDIIKWWNEFFEEFGFFLRSVFRTHKFYLPAKPVYRIANNISFVTSHEKISIMHQGFVFPGIWSLMGKRYFKLQNKFNHFRFEIPITSENIPPVLERKFLFEKKHFEYNREFLPSFFTFTLNLHIK